MLVKTNKSQAPMETFLVGTKTTTATAGDTLAVGGNSFPIEDGELGIVSADPNSSKAPGTFLTAGDTATTVKAVQIVQGTPNSSNLANVNPFGVGHKAIVKSGIIRKDKVRSIATYHYELPQYSIWYLTGLSGITANTRYYLNITMEGERIDTTHGMNREVIREVIKTDATLPTNAADFVLQNLGLNVNKLSKYLNLNTGFAGTKPIIAFGVKSDGTNDADDINDIATTTGITGSSLSSKNFAQYTRNGTTHQCEYTPDMTFVNSLNKAIGHTSALGTAKLVSLGSVTPGSAATIDGLLIVAFRETPIAAYDDIKEQSIRLAVNFGSEFGTKQPTFTLNHVCKPFEGANSGRQLDLRYKDRAAQMIFNLQNWPVDGRPYPVPESYIDVNKNYMATIVEYYDQDNSISGEHESVGQVVMLLEATVSNPTAAAGTAFDVDTVVATTTLEGVIGAWLRSNSGVDYKGTATSSAIFLPVNEQ